MLATNQLRKCQQRKEKQNKNHQDDGKVQKEKQNEIEPF